MKINKPAIKEVYFSAFCRKKGIRCRYDINRPFAYRGVEYATDGCIMVWRKTTMPDTTNRRLPLLTVTVIPAGCPATLTRKLKAIKPIEHAKVACDCYNDDNKPNRGCIRCGGTGFYLLGSMALGKGRIVYFNVNLINLILSFGPARYGCNNIAEEALIYFQYDDHAVGGALMTCRWEG